MPGTRRPMKTTATWLTASSSGAIAILQIRGECNLALKALGIAGPLRPGIPCRRDLGGIDEGIVSLLDQDTLIVMPHGGIRVRQLLQETMEQAGINLSEPDTVDPRSLHPEAGDRYEALMLETLTRAASPLAIDLLVQQPERWRSRHSGFTPDPGRTRRLNRLITPPLVVITGAPNVGKSTLMNRLVGRTVSIEADLEGTTRDYTRGLVDLGGVVVDLVDTPGRRVSSDHVEQEAILISDELLEQAECIIELMAPATRPASRQVTASLAVMNKSDLDGTEQLARQQGCGCCISAATGDGIEELVLLVRNELVTDDDLECGDPWLFDPALESAGRSETDR
ncbi:MAG: hypothetical protein CMJ32_11370 [Phycisphaerae bacterium]|nr:hypothetical protein [Phycisphaerae bacterium]